MYQRKTETELSSEEQIARIRMPRGKEVFGEILQLHGDRRMKVACSDGKERMCRVPGRLKRKLWVRVGDIVIVEPWPIQGDEKGDLIWRYNHVQAAYIRKKGYLTQND